MRTRGIEYVITLLFLTLLLAAVCPGVKACETCNGANGWLVDDGSGYGLPQVENPSNPAGQGPFSARISGGTWYKQSEKSTWTVCTGTTMEFNVTAIDYDFCDCGNEWVADDPVYYLWKRSDVEVQEGTSNTYTYTFNSTGTYTIKVGGDGYSHLNPSRGCYRYDGYASLYTTPITINVVEPVLVMETPAQGQTTAYTGNTSGTGTGRLFYKAFVAATNPSTDGLSVTVHMGDQTKAAPGSDSGKYTTANWDITTKRSPKTVYATAPHATQSGNATVHFKKNLQLITCAPDYMGCDYVLGANGPSEFDCSGFQYYLYNFVGITVDDKTAQGYYDASTHIAAGDRLPGDWLFFDWDHSPPHSDCIDHTGVYSGDNQMVHASSSAGEVVTVTLTEYYDEHAFYGHMYGANERF